MPDIVTYGGWAEALVALAILPDVCSGVCFLFALRDVVISSEGKTWVVLRGIRPVDVLTG